MSDMITFSDAIQKVDDYLQSTNGRKLISIGEIQDVLLDMRLDLVALDAQQDFSSSTPNPDSSLTNDSQAIQYASL